MGSNPLRKSTSVVDTTEEMSSGTMARMEMSSISTSSTKMSPVTGALKMAARAPAAPHPSSSVVSR